MEKILHTPLGALPVNTSTPVIPPDILSELVEKSPWAHAIFSGESLELLHWNSAFAHWIDHKTAKLPEHLRIADLLAPNSRAEFHRSILSHTKVFSTWEGPLFMRSLGGDQFQAYACIISFRTTGGDDLCAFIASTSHLAAASSEISNISDNELLYALLETVPMAIYFKDLKSRFIRVSAYQAKRHDFSDANELVGLSDFDLFSLEHAQPAFTSEQAIIATGQPLIDLEERETYSDQPDTWVSTSKFPLTNRAGHVVGTFGLSKDITAQHNLSHRQSQIEKSLAASAERDALITKISDEIKASSSSMLQNMQALQASFNELIPLLAAYKQLSDANASGQTLPGALQLVKALEQRVPITRLVAEIPSQLQQSMGQLGAIEGLVNTLHAPPPATSATPGS